MEDKKIFDWIGGKKWLSDKITGHAEDIIFYNDITQYVEPFCGSLGSLTGMLKILKKNNINKIILNDINTNLINVYECVLETPNELYELMKEIELGHENLLPDEIFKLKKTKDKEVLKVLMNDAKNYYIEIRNSYNQIKNDKSKKLTSSAQFLFLMYRTFNGIYRENGSGGFNSPYGWTNKKINFENKKDAIFNLHENFKQFDIEFHNLDFDTFLSKIDNINNTLFYFDPPYLNKDIKENSYNKDSFGLNEQNKLLEYINNFNNIIYSNHNMEIFRNFFSNEKYGYEIVNRKNIMTAKNEDRVNDIEEILSYTK